MTSEDWKTVLLTFIAMIGTIFGPVIVGYMEYLRRKASQAAVDSSAAKEMATETKQLINGRLDELLAAKDKERVIAVAEAYTQGHSKGMNQTAQAMIENPKVPVDAKTVAEVIAASSRHDRLLLM